MHKKVCYIYKYYKQAKNINNSLFKISQLKKKRLNQKKDRKS